jgi:hypothetical protein
MSLVKKSNDEQNYPPMTSIKVITLAATIELPPTSMKGM